MSDPRLVGHVLGVQIDALTWHEAVERLLGWARARQSRYVAISNVHVVVSASRDVAYRQVIDGADMATPDGAPGCCGMPKFRLPIDVGSYKRQFCLLIWCT